jgi:WD40 repeat protein
MGLRKYGICLQDSARALYGMCILSLNCIEGIECRTPNSDHHGEVLDVGFNTIGSKTITASADHSARIYDSMTFECLKHLKGHENEISKVSLI